MVVNKSIWQKKEIQSIKEILTSPIDGIAQKEALFKVTTAPPSTYFKSLKTYRTILIPIILDDPNHYFSSFNEGLDTSIKEKVKQEGVVLQKSVNKYAAGQYIVYLIAKNQQALLSFAETKKNELRNYFHQREITELKAHIKQERKNKNAITLIQEKFSSQMIIPKGFEIALDTTHFLWLRQSEPSKDLNIFISKITPDEISFDDNSIIGYRNHLCKKYIFGNTNRKDSYMITETILGPYFKNTVFNKGYAKECRGLWKLNNLSMGGTFISFTFLSNDKQFFYLEAFLHNPGKKKITELRKLEAILKTFTP